MDKDKPLWVTEFGVLFPSFGNPYFQVSDEDTANFMTQAFDFMLGYKDPQLGYSGDNNRLVQKWTWFSLNDVTSQYGGSFFDPGTHQITQVGQRFIQYDPSLDAVPVENPDVFVVPGSLAISGVTDALPSDQVYYRVNLKVGNNLSSDRHTGVTVNLYDGETLSGSTSVDLPRCGGTAEVSFFVKGLLPDESHNFTAQVSVRPGNGSDTNLSNNRLSFGSILLPESTASLTRVAFLPVVLN